MLLDLLNNPSKNVGGNGSHLWSHE
jgi:hypothetical protein